MTEDSHTGFLVDLGFTALEERIYTFLVGESPATGYRIAKAIGKPVANTYKAINSLVAKGAVVLDEGARRRCRAVPYQDFLALLEQRFQERKATAERNLALLPAPTQIAGTYSITTVDQVFEQARSMLDRAERSARLDLSLLPLEKLGTDLVRCTERSVDVAVKAPSLDRIQGVRLIRDPLGAAVAESDQGEWIHMVVDSDEHLFALLSPDGAMVRQASWSSSPDVSAFFGRGIEARIALCEIGNLLASGGTMKDVREAFGRKEGSDHLQL